MFSFHSLTNNSVANGFITYLYYLWIYLLMDLFIAYLLTIFLLLLLRI